MRLILSCPIIGPDAMDICMGLSLSSVLLLIHWTCRVSTTHIPTFRQQCKLSLRYTVSAFHPIPSFLFHVDCFLELELVVPLDKDSIYKKTHCFKDCVAMSTESICIETVNPLLISCCVKALNSGVRSQSLKIRHDHIFETSRFVFMGLESLQICIKLSFWVESCRHKLTHRAWAKTASIYSNNRFASICRRADTNLVNDRFTR